MQTLRLAYRAIDEEHEGEQAPTLFDLLAWLHLEYRAANPAAADAADAVAPRAQGRARRRRGAPRAAGEPRARASRRRAPSGGARRAARATARRRRTRRPCSRRRARSAR